VPEAGIDPDSRVGEGRGMPAWCTFREAAQREDLHPDFTGDRLQRREPDTLPFAMNLETQTPDEVANAVGVIEHMRELMRVPTIKAGAVMPDACPAGSAKGRFPSAASSLRKTPSIPAITRPTFVVRWPSAF
jgi:hypothetical protein